MLEKRSATNGMPDQADRCSASVSAATLDSAYVVVGYGKWSSSIGAYRGGTSNGRPSVVSLEAQTTRSSPRWAAAWKTLKFIAVLRLNVSAGVNISGAGMLARWITASVPSSVSTAWP